MESQNEKLVKEITRLTISLREKDSLLKNWQTWTRLADDKYRKLDKESREKVAKLEKELREWKRQSTRQSAEIRELIKVKQNLAIRVTELQKEIHWRAGNIKALEKVVENHHQSRIESQPMVDPERSRLKTEMMSMQRVMADQQITIYELQEKIIQLEPRSNPRLRPIVFDRPTPTTGNPMMNYLYLTPDRRKIASITPFQPRWSGTEQDETQFLANLQ